MLFDHGSQKQILAVNRAGGAGLRFGRRIFWRGCFALWLKFALSVDLIC